MVKYSSRRPRRTYCPRFAVLVAVTSLLSGISARSNPRTFRSFCDTPNHGGTPHNLQVSDRQLNHNSRGDATSRQRRLPLQIDCTRPVPYPTPIRFQLRSRVHLSPACGRRSRLFPSARPSNVHDPNASHNRRDSAPGQALSLSSFALTRYVKIRGSKF